MSKENTRIMHEMLIHSQQPRVLHQAPVLSCCKGRPLGANRISGALSFHTANNSSDAKSPNLPHIQAKASYSSTVSAMRYIHGSGNGVPLSHTSSTFSGRGLWERCVRQCGVPCQNAGGGEDAAEQETTPLTFRTMIRDTTGEVKRVRVHGNGPTSAIKVSHEERQAMANLAKDGVRSRRNHRMQTCQTPICPITPSRLLDSISWSISEPTSKACIYIDSLSVDVIEDQGSAFFDTKPDGKESDTLFVNLSRPLTESQKSELIFKSHFLAILFPVDRFSEMGPLSRTFFSNKGFTCLQVLDHIYSFYQENMSFEEIKVAIHTDSRHADRLRATYFSKAASEVGYVEFKRIEFLGSRKSFEMLKRVSGDNNSNVYELVIRA